MERMKGLSARMEAVAHLVPDGLPAADIGCDHGYVAIRLIQRGICPYVYAVEVRPGPLARAKEHIMQAGLFKQITPVLSDGLTNVPVGPDGVKTMIAAGMGGRLTVRILSDHPDKTAALSYLVLEPQSEVWLVRGWLMEHGFVITKEDLVLEEGKYYPVIQAAGKEKAAGAKEAAARQERLVCRLTAAGLSAQETARAIRCFGPCLLYEKQPILISFLQHTIEKNDALLKRLADAAGGARTAYGSGRIDRRKSRLMQERILAEKTRRFLQSE